MNLPTIDLKNFPLWNKIKGKRIPHSFDIELTARCNLNCRHCYINLPVADSIAKRKELTLAELKDIADQAVELGAIWVLLTGGEPLLRKDFADIYLYFRKKGLLVTVFTNATAITQEHVELFRCYPPRNLEITVYGVTRDVYQAVTRKSGSFSSFTRGIQLLKNNNIPIRLKAMAIRSNFHQLPKIAEYCREGTKDFFRFDTTLHMRLDQNAERNREITEERLTPEEIITLEKKDNERVEALKNYQLSGQKREGLFQCGAGTRSFSISYDGFFRICSSLTVPEHIYDLRRGNLKTAWNEWIPKKLSLKPSAERQNKKCDGCAFVNLCLTCPAHAILETGSLEGRVEYFCNVAHSRAGLVRNLQNKTIQKNEISRVVKS